MHNIPFSERWRGTIGFLEGFVSGLILGAGLAVYFFWGAFLNG